MNKLRLNLESLSVQSFATDGARRGGGTVRGNESYPSQLAGCTWGCPGTDAISCITCAGCDDSRVMSCRASDCMQEH
jgi:hypothetical protein